NLEAKAGVAKVAPADQQAHRLLSADHAPPTCVTSQPAPPPHRARNRASRAHLIWSGSPDCRADRILSRAPKPAGAPPATAADKVHSFCTSLDMVLQISHQIINAVVVIFAPFVGCQLAEQ